jgi:hypothetical protein
LSEQETSLSEEEIGSESSMGTSSEVADPADEGDSDGMDSTDSDADSSDSDSDSTDS